MDSTNATMDSLMVDMAKRLADNNSKVRAKAVNELKNTVATMPADTSLLDMMKLWKGLFYCMWMSDKLPVQQDLATRLASFVLNIHDRVVAVLYLEAFWKTMMREWSGIDYLRLNKYYYLCKRVIAYTGDFVAAHGYDVELMESMAEMFNEYPLCVHGDSKAPLGITYLVCESYLSIFAGTGDLKPSCMQKIELMAPIINLLLATQNETIVEKLTSHLFDPIFGEGGEDEVQFEWAEDELLMLAKAILMVMDDESIPDEDLEGLSLILNKISPRFGDIDGLLERLNGPIDASQGDDAAAAPVVEPELTETVETVGVVEQARLKKKVLFNSKKSVKLFDKKKPIDGSPLPQVPDPTSILSKESKIPKMPKKKRRTSIREVELPNKAPKLRASSRAASVDFM